jgi:hypothetical protein
MRTPFFAIAMLGSMLGAAACAPAADVDPACFNRKSDKIGGPFSLTSHTGARIVPMSARKRSTRSARP